MGHPHAPAHAAHAHCVRGGLVRTNMHPVRTRLRAFALTAPPGAIRPARCKAPHRDDQMPLGSHASAPAARAHGVRDGLVCTVLASVRTNMCAFALTPLRRHLPGSLQSPIQLCRRRLARPMEAALRVFASHGCVFRALHRRVKGQKSGQTCTVRSLFFRRPSGPSAVGSDVDQPGVPTRPREGGTFAQSESHSGYRGQNAA